MTYAQLEMIDLETSSEFQSDIRESKPRTSLISYLGSMPNDYSAPGLRGRCFCKLGM